MSAFVVFSMLGFYPVTAGIPVYDVASPVFDKATNALMPPPSSSPGIMSGGTCAPAFALHPLR